MKDAELVLRARGGDELAFQRLANSHADLIRVHIRKYFAPGANEADLQQEGLIGLHKAVRDFRPGQGSGFRNFASICIERQVITAVKTATRNKHQPLNRAASLNAPIRDDDLTLGDVLPNIRADADPLDHLISSEEVDTIVLATKGFSDIEREACLRVAEGYSYEEIAERQGVNAKSIDNAMQRAQRKIADAPRRFRPMRHPAKVETNPARWRLVGVRKPAMVAAACELRAQRLSYKQISESLGICQMTAARYIKLARPDLHHLPGVGRKRGRPIGSGRLGDDDLRALHARHVAEGISAAALARSVFAEYEFASWRSANNQIRDGWRRLGLRIDSGTSLCSAVNQRGKRCRRRASMDDTLCYLHAEPFRAAAQAEHMRAAT